MQSIVKAAVEAVFMIKDEQYKSGLEGSIPVLVQSVRKLLFAEFFFFFFLNPENNCLKFSLAAKLVSYS